MKTRLYLCFNFTKLKPEVQTKKDYDAKGNREPRNLAQKTQTTPAPVHPGPVSDDDSEDKESDSEVTDARVGPGNNEFKPDVQTNNESVANGNLQTCLLYKLICI